MITVRLEGGLGNSMFQYALGRMLSIERGSELRFDISSYATNPIADCSYWLEGFNLDIQGRLADSEEIKRLQQYRSIPGTRHQLRNFLYADPTIYIEEKEALVFQPDVLNAQKTVYLHGWWQSEQYFEHIRDVLLKDFTVRTPLQGKNAVVAEQMRNTNSIGIHMRRLDYTSNPKTRAFHGELPQAYYDQALEKMAVENPTLFIFSDDPAWVREHIQFPHPTVYIDWNDWLTQQHEDIRLMSMCKNFIAANSSFSWWGAWLIQNPEKRIVVPTPWVADPKMAKKLAILPENWIKIPGHYITS